MKPRRCEGYPVFMHIQLSRKHRDRESRARALHGPGVPQVGPSFLGPCRGLERPTIYTVIHNMVPLLFLR